MRPSTFRLCRLAFGLAADAVAGLVKMAAVALGAVCALVTILVVTLWDEDPHALRARVENWRTAWSDDWQPKEKREAKALAEGGKHGIR
jgi:hypothetical protein